MPPYTAAAIEGELVAIQEAEPKTAKAQIAAAAFQIGRWCGGGYVVEREAKRTIWKIANASGVIELIGRDAAKAIITEHFSRGARKPRHVPATQGLKNG